MMMMFGSFCVFPTAFLFSVNEIDDRVRWETWPSDDVRKRSAEADRRRPADESEARSTETVATSDNGSAIRRR